MRCEVVMFTDLFESRDVDDVEVQAAGVEEPDDLTDGLRTDDLAAGQHGLYGGGDPALS